ncbi:MAG: ferrous iron transport protein A [Acidobacteria bacterium]|nr:ferrous iron transport protein A [Acidobacteriota bacterium]
MNTTTVAATPLTSMPAVRPVPLTQLRPGQSARLFGDRLSPEDGHLVSALGLTEHCLFRLCKRGNPWIVQVRSTRIGLADTVARHLLVLPEDDR